MTKIKICGISRLPDAEVAMRAGADFIGIVFAKSQRMVNLDQARLLVNGIRTQNDHPRIVGVFANNPIKEVNETARVLDLDLVQLSGEEPDQYTQEVEAPVIRAIHLDPKLGMTTRDLAKRSRTLLGLNVMPLLDTKIGSMFGGTGRQFDHSLARHIANDIDFLLAGGLTPENVGATIEFVHPWGVDVSSGVETDGQKDHEKIRLFTHAVRAANPGSEGLSSV